MFFFGSSEEKGEVTSKAKELKKDTNKSLEVGHNETIAKVESSDVSTLEHNNTKALNEKEAITELMIKVVNSKPVATKLNKRVETLNPITHEAVKVEQNSTTELPQVPEVVKVELDNEIETIVIPTIPEVPKVPNVVGNTVSLLSNESNNKLHKEEVLKDEALYKNRILEKELQQVREENKKLASQLDNVKHLAIIGEKQARAYESNTQKNISTLEENLTTQIKEKEALEEKLADELKKEEALHSQLDNVKHLATEGEVKARAYESNTKNKISALEAKITELMRVAKQKSEKSHLDFVTLLSSKKSLEANLTSELAQEKALSQENVQLQESLTILLKEKTLLEANMKKLEAEKAVAEVKAKEEAEKLAKEKAEAEAKAKEEAEKAAAEAKAKEEAEKAVAEAKAKEEAEKVAAEAKAKEEAEKAAAEAKAKEESEKVAAEAKAKEEAEKAAAEAKAKEEAEKAAAKAKAKEEAEKAATEAKAKEEAEKAATEAKAKEEAEKAAAEAKAKAAETKLINAFSLTKVAFRTGSSVLTLASKQRLDKAIETMKQYEGYQYQIQGFTDNVGKASSNLKLSDKRAKAVKAYLISKGIDVNILSAEGFGSADPIASNDTKQGREANRRVVFKIVQ